MTKEPIEIVGIENPYSEFLILELIPIEKGRIYQIAASTAAEKRIRKSGNLTLKLKGGPVKTHKLLTYVDVWSPKKRSKAPQAGVKPSVKPVD